MGTGRCGSACVDSSRNRYVAGEVLVLSSCFISAACIFTNINIIIASSIYVLRVYVLYLFSSLFALVFRVQVFYSFLVRFLRRAFL